MEIPAGSSTDDGADACVICLSDIAERATTVPCKHDNFDFLCLASWLQNRSTCPLCKTEVAAVRYGAPSDPKTYTVRTTHRPSTTPPTSHTHHNLPRRPRPRRRYSAPTPDVALLRRRYVYRHDLYSLHVGTNRISQYCNLSPATIKSSPDLQSRARTFIRRELRVFSFLHADSSPSSSSSSSSTPTAAAATTSSNAEFLLSYILSILQSVDIKAHNGHAEDLLSGFLGRPHTRLFLHELHAWLRSPYAKLEDWDRNVQYGQELPEAFDVEGRPLRGGKPRRYARSRSPEVEGRRHVEERERIRRYAVD